MSLVSMWIFNSSICKLCLCHLHFYVCVTRITLNNLWCCTSSEELETKLKMINLGSTSETTNEDIMFTIKGGTLSNNPIIAIFNNEHNHCNITHSCPKLSNEGASGSLVVCDDGIPTCEKIAFKSPLKPMTLTHLKPLDNDLDIERTTKIPTKSYPQKLQC